MPAENTFGRRERLKGRKPIEQLFQKGSHFMYPPFKVWYQIMKPEERNQRMDALAMGVGVGTRYFKKATRRNRIKRLVREAWRIQKKELGKNLQESGLQMHVFIVYVARDLPRTEPVNEKVRGILEKLNQLIHEKVHRGP